MQSGGRKVSNACFCLSSYWVVWFVRVYRNIYRKRFFIRYVPGSLDSLLCCSCSFVRWFFLSAYLLDKLNHNWLGGKDSYDRILVFVGYSMVVTFVLNIVSGLFSIVVLHWILQIYTIVIVFEGVRRWLKVEENKQTAFTLVATIIILVCPAVIEFIFNKLSVILN